MISEGRRKGIEREQQIRETSFWKTKVEGYQIIMGIKLSNVSVNTMNSETECIKIRYVLEHIVSSFVLYIDIQV
jgi:hypothetical protein